MNLLKSLLFGLGLLATSLSQALTVAPYSAEALAKAQAAGEPVALHFHASWCPTCRAQSRTLEVLKAETGLDIAVLTADYDKEAELKRQHKVHSQSTLIVFKGKTEKARAVGQSSPDDLRALLGSAP